MDPELLDVIGYIMFMVGIPLSTNIGRTVAHRKHDTDLIERYGGSSKINIYMSAMPYFFAIATLVFNVISIFISNMLSVLGRLAFDSSLITVAIGIEYTVAIILISYLYYRPKYRYIDKPLTCEGKLALDTIPKTKSLGRKSEEPVSGVVNKAYTSVGALGRATKSFLDREDTGEG